MVRNTGVYVMYLSLLFIWACSGQEEAGLHEDNGRSTVETSSIKAKGRKYVNYELSEAVTCGILDRDGVLWFGTNNEGVYRYDGASFSNISKADGLCSNNISSIIEDKDGDLWFGTPVGICQYDRKSFTRIPLPWSDTSSVWLDKVYPVINPNAVHAMMQDKNGDIWIGTGGAGAYRYDGNTFTQYLTDIGARYDDSLQHNWIPSISVDSKGNVWFASMSHGGVSRYDGDSFTHFAPEDGMSDDMVRSSFLDRSGNMWFGSNGNRNGGLDRYDGKSFSYFNKKDGICNTNIRCIYEDATGNLWLGSGRGGICIYDGTTFSEFTTNDGQSFERILWIIEDADGNIWFGGNFGKLYRYDGNVLMDYTQKKI